LRLLDIYIIKRIISTFFFVVLILLAVVSVIDLTDKMDKYAKADLSAIQILGYYADYMAWIGGLLTPITIFIATVYVCSRMAAHTEVIAILSSGISFQRMLLPYFEGAFIIAAISFALNGWIIPNSNKTRIEFEMRYLKNRQYLDRQNVHMQIAPNTYLYIQSYQNQSKTGFHFTMERFEDNRLVEKLNAANITWDSVKHKWTLRDWELKKVNQIFEKANGIVSSDSSENITKGTELDTTLIIHPDEFESDYKMYDGLTMGELNEQIRTLRERGSAGVEPYQVERFTRYASPFTIFILVFMGVIVSSRKSRGGTGVQIAVGFVLSFIFIIFFMLFRTYAETGYTWYVWIPNLIFAAIALVMYKYVPR
jgi:lipopolysaccharide export system permease protein